MTWYQFRAHFQFEMICKSLIGSSLFHLQGIYVYDLFPSLVLGKRMKITQLLYNYTNLDINHYFHIPSNFVIIFIILCINSRSKCMYMYNMYKYVPYMHQRLVDVCWHWSSVVHFILMILKVFIFLYNWKHFNHSFYMQVAFFFIKRWICKQLFLLLVYFQFLPQWIWIFNHNSKREIK